MTKKRIAQLRKQAELHGGDILIQGKFLIVCLNEIERLQKVEKDAAKALKAALKGRK